MSVWTFENPSAGVRAPRTEAAQPPHVMFGTSRVYSLPPLSPVVIVVVEGGVELGAGDAPLQPMRTMSPMRPRYLGMERSPREKNGTTTTRRGQTVSPTLPIRARRVR